MSGSAILVIDLLNDFLDQWDEEERAILISRTNELIDHFRAAELPIIWVRQEFEPDLSDAFLEMREKGIRITIRGTIGAQFCAELHQHDGDHFVIKKRYSAFFQTPLEAILKRLDVGELTLSGINTHACIRMAAIDAYQRDLKVIIASDCVGSYDKRHGEISLRYLDGKIAELKTNQEILSAIGVR